MDPAERSIRTDLTVSHFCRPYEAHDSVKLILEPRHDLSPMELDVVEDRLYEYNRTATGRDDGEGIGFVIRDDAGRTVGVTAGYTWAGVSEIKQMWVDEAYRGLWRRTRKRISRVLPT